MFHGVSQASQNGRNPSSHDVVVAEFQDGVSLLKDNTSVVMQKRRNGKESAEKRKKRTKKATRESPASESYDGGGVGSCSQDGLLERAHYRKSRTGCTIISTDWMFELVNHRLRLWG